MRVPRARTHRYTGADLEGTQGEESEQLCSRNTVSVRRIHSRDRRAQQHGNSSSRTRTAMAIDCQSATEFSQFTSVSRISRNKHCALAEHGPMSLVSVHRASKQAVLCVFLFSGSYRLIRLSKPCGISREILRWRPGIRVRKCSYCCH